MRQVLQYRVASSVPEEREADFFWDSKWDVRKVLTAAVMLKWALKGTEFSSHTGRTETHNGKVNINKCSEITSMSSVHKLMKMLCTWNTVGVQ